MTSAPTNNAMDAADTTEALLSETHDEGAISIIRRGMRVTPAVREGLVATFFMGAAIAIGRLVIPVLIQQALDRGVLGEEVRPRTVIQLSALALLVILAAAVISLLTQRRLVAKAQEALAQLRNQAFERVHALSIADHNDTQRGVLVARVTSDAEALSRFVQWGLLSWTVNPTIIVGTLAVLFYYSWQIALVVLVAYLPVLPVMRWLQRRQLAAYDAVRSRVGEMFNAFSESVQGANVVRAYGIEGHAEERLNTSIIARYRARMRASFYTAIVFVVGDLFGSIALAGVLGIGLIQREAWGLEAGELVACLFLATLLQAPIAELSETIDQTQTAVSGWRKMLDLIEQPIDVVEPVDGVVIPTGAIAVSARNVGFSYRTGPPVLHGVSVEIPAGANVAIVGETGSGKTTFAKLLCRLADPTAGEVLLNGAHLTDVSAASRLSSVRMAPQDGFLFNTTIGENIRFGRPDARDDEIRAAFDLLDLGWWIDAFPGGLDAPVGERGDALSVGERQLVALVRAALADPGLLILDEATSAVDPETDQAITTALRKLAEGRTLVSIAHRLATAEAADLVLVFEAGQLAQAGPHAQLVNQPGPYAVLHQAWVGNTRAA